MVILQLCRVKRLILLCFICSQAFSCIPQYIPIWIVFCDFFTVFSLCLQVQVADVDWIKITSPEELSLMVSLLDDFVLCFPDCCLLTKSFAGRKSSVH